MPARLRGSGGSSERERGIGFRVISGFFFTCWVFISV